MNLSRIFKLFKKNDRGVTALEYAILAGIVVLAVVTLKSTITGVYTTAFSGISSQVSSAVNNASSSS